MGGWREERRFFCRLQGPWARSPEQWREACRDLPCENHTAEEPQTRLSALIGQVCKSHRHLLARVGEGWGACAGAANYVQSRWASLAILIGSLAASCRQVGSQPHAFSMAGRPAPTAGLAVLAHATCACPAPCPPLSSLLVLFTCITASLSTNFTAILPGSVGLSLCRPIPERSLKGLDQRCGA